MWRKRIEAVLRASMRYCFKGLPELDEEEFCSSDNGGFLGFILAEVNDVRKRAYLAGYLAGVQDFEGREEVRIANNLNAQSRWEEYDKGEC